LLVNLHFTALGVYFKATDPGNRILAQNFALNPNLNSKFTVLFNQTRKIDPKVPKKLLFSD